MDANQFRDSAKAAVEDITKYFHDLTTSALRVTPTVSPGYLRPRLPTTAPDNPEPFTAILSDIKDHIMPGLTHWQHPNFMAFFPAATTFPSLLGELYSAAFTAPAFNWLCSPACTELETIVLDWVARMLGLPECFLSDGPTGGGGVIQGSASEAIIVVMVAARERAVRTTLEKEGLFPEEPGESEERLLQREDRAAEIRGRLVALGSEQAHSSTQKAANILGLRHRSIRAGLDSGCRITGPALRTRLADLRAQGLQPCYLTVCLGTTATCAVDDFEGIAAVVREEREAGRELWVHVDAAYAGAALVCEEMREACGAKWLGEFESFDVNLHKWLLVNFDASCLYTRHTPHLTRTLSITPSYLLNPTSLTTSPKHKPPTDYRDYQLPLGRRFRALKIWFVLRTYGVSGLQKLVREHVRLGEVFESLCGAEGWEKAVRVVSGAKFALVVVRVVAVPDEVRDGGEVDGGMKEKAGTRENPSDEMNDFGRGSLSTTTTAATQIPKPSQPEKEEVSEADNELTKRVYEHINAQGEIFVTSSVVDGVYTIRFVSANPNANEGAVRRAFACLVESIEAVRGLEEDGMGKGEEGVGE